MSTCVTVSVLSLRGASCNSSMLAVSLMLNSTFSMCLCTWIISTQQKNNIKNTIFSTIKTSTFYMLLQNNIICVTHLSPLVGSVSYLLESRYIDTFRQRSHHRLYVQHMSHMTRNMNPHICSGCLCHLGNTLKETWKSKSAVFTCVYCNIR